MGLIMPRPKALVLILICMLMTFEMNTVSGEFSGYDGDDNDLPAMTFDNNKSTLRIPADKRASSIYVHRRGCIRRGGACDLRPNDCCFSSSCRCNLWGSNCRCQRVGLFQKWG